MKKIILLFYFITCMQAAFSQDKTADSLQDRLVNTASPIERFHLIDNKLRDLLSNSGMVDSALSIQLFQIAIELKSDSLLATSYNRIGNYYSVAKGDNTTALEYYFKALPIAEKTKNKRRISSIYFDIAEVYSYLQNNEEHIKFARKGRDNLPDKSHPLYYFMLVQYQANVALYFIKTKNVDSALYYAHALEQTCLKTKKILTEYSSMHINGAAQAVAGKKDLADLYYKKAIALSPALKGSIGKLRFGLTYIPYLINDRRFEEAKEQARQLLVNGKEFNNNNFRLLGAGFMRQVSDSLHQTDSAYYYARMEIAMTAQIHSQNNINKLQALAFNEQIRSIEEEAKQAEAEQQRKQNIQYALLALGIITFVILFLALSRRHITNTKVIQFLGVVALLVVFEFLNLLLHPFLEKITHHNPILMLLALVCIAALLVPLHHKLEKWATHKLVEKNKQIRLAAAKKTIEELEKDNS